MIKKIPPIYSLLTIGYFLFSTPIRAAVDLSTEFQLQPGVSVSSKFPTISSVIGNLLPNIYIFSGIILLFILLGGGFMMISGGDNPDSIAKGKEAAIGAIIGFVIIFMSYWIIQIIEILTGVPILNTRVLNQFLGI